MKRSSSPIKVQVGRRAFVKINARKYDWRDIYHFILTLSWPEFDDGTTRFHFVFLRIRNLPAWALRDAMLTPPTLVEGLIPLFSSVPSVPKSAAANS